MSWMSSPQHGENDWIRLQFGLTILSTTARSEPQKEIDFRTDGNPSKALKLGPSLTCDLELEAQFSSSTEEHFFPCSTLGSSLEQGEVH
jgi:hypothetical protein